MNHGGATPLYIATQVGHLEIVEFLLQTNQVDVNHVVNNIGTPICVAVHEEDLDIVKILVQHGADVNPLLIQNMTLLSISLCNEDFEMSTFLIQNNADVIKTKSYLHEKHDVTALDLLEEIK